MELSKNKRIFLLVFGIAVYFLTVFGVIYICKTDNITLTSKRIVQNTTYILLFLFSLILIKLSKKTYSSYGFFIQKLPIQLLTGFGLGAGVLLLKLLFSSAPSIPENLLYTVFSQIAVGISEETFWHGFALLSIKELTKSKDTAVIVSALLFAVMHLPVNFSFGQVIFAFITGALFSVLRTEFEDTIGIIPLSLGHAIANIF